SLGRLEELAVRLAGITGRARPSLARKAVVVLVADHGVVAEAVSAYPPEVTARMVGTFLEGRAAINVLARRAAARVVVVDGGGAAPAAGGAGRLHLDRGGAGRRRPLPRPVPLSGRRPPLRRAGPPRRAGAPGAGAASGPGAAAGRGDRGGAGAAAAGRRGR